MGGIASKAKGSKVMRKPGDLLNGDGWPGVSQQIITPPSTKVKKIAICRCWKAAQFPICDNTHKRLRFQGINVGPAMLEIRNIPTNPALQNTGVSQDGCDGTDGKMSGKAFGTLLAMGGASAGIAAGLTLVGVPL